MGRESMSDREAESEVQRRFGADEVAWHPYYAKRGDLRHCCVGLRVGDVMDDWIVCGHGRTWEEACQMAAARKRK